MYVYIYIYIYIPVEVRYYISCFRCLARDARCSTMSHLTPPQGVRQIHLKLTWGLDT